MKPTPLPPASGPATEATQSSRAKWSLGARWFTATEGSPSPRDPGEIEIADADILEAMREIPGYLDISTADFRSLYHLAYHHAMDRMFQGINARRLMIPDVQPLTLGDRLAEAIPRFVDQGLKTLPVIDGEGRLAGILTETDVLRALGAGTFMALLRVMLAEGGCLSPQAYHHPVRDLMTSPAVSVPLEASYLELFQAFTRHPGRGMPVTSADGRLAGMLLRKHFLQACPFAGASPETP